MHYISHQASFGYSGLKEIEQILHTQKHKVSYWQKNQEYSLEGISKAKAVVFVLPNYAWEYSLHKLSKGMLSELVYCLNNKKDMYIAYKRASGAIGIYAAEITDDLMISGIRATEGNNTIMENVLDSCETTQNLPDSTYFY